MVRTRILIAKLLQDCANSRTDDAAESTRVSAGETSRGFVTHGRSDGNVRIARNQTASTIPSRPLSKPTGMQKTPTQRSESSLSELGTTPSPPSVLWLAGGLVEDDCSVDGFEQDGEANTKISGDSIKQDSSAISTLTTLQTTPTPASAFLRHVPSSPGNGVRQVVGEDLATRGNRSVFEQIRSSCTTPSSENQVEEWRQSQTPRRRARGGCFSGPDPRLYSIASVGFGTSTSGEPSGDQRYVECSGTGL